MASTLLISAAVKAGTSKTGRKVIVAVIAIICFTLIYIICIVSSMISVLAGSGKISADFNAQDTEVYQDIQYIYSDYIDNKKIEMDKMEDEIIRENTYVKQVEQYNPNTEKMELVEKEFCDVEVSQNFERVKTVYIMAYLSCTHKEEYASTCDVSVDKRELYDFLDGISSVEIVQTGNQYEISNLIKTPYEVAEIYFEDEAEQSMFLHSYRILDEMIGTEEFAE